MKNNAAVVNGRKWSEVYEYASDRLLTIISSVLPGCIQTGMLPSILIDGVLIPLLKLKTKDPSVIYKHRPIAIARALS